MAVVKWHRQMAPSNGTVRQMAPSNGTILRQMALFCVKWHYLASNGTVRQMAPSNGKMVVVGHHGAKLPLNVTYHKLGSWLLLGKASEYPNGQCACISACPSTYSHPWRSGIACASANLPTRCSGQIRHPVMGAFFTPSIYINDNL